MSRKHLWLGAGILVAALGVFYFFFHKSNEVPTVKAELGNVEERVNVVGKVTSATNVDLSFESAGKVAHNFVSVGDTVKEGQPLIALDEAVLRANLNSAKASLQKAQVEYNSLKNNSATSYSLTVNGFTEALNNAYIQADDAVRNNTDQFYSNPRQSNATFDPSFTDGGYNYLSNIPSSVKSSLSDQRIAMEKLLDDWESEVKTIGTSKTDLNNAYNYSRKNLLAVQDFLDSIASAINSITTENYTYRTTIIDYKSTVSTARSKITTALSDIAAAKADYNNGPNQEQGSFDNVLAAESNIQSLKENIKAIEADLDKTILTSPINGVVTKSEGNRGETVKAGATVVSILSEHEKQVEAQVSEVHIGRVETGNPVEITFDAFPDEIYHGKVSYVDPGEVMIDDVPTYKVTVTFTDPLPERVRSGFTANLNISTATHNNVVKVPAYAVTKDPDGYKVKIKSNNGPELKKVEIGLKGNDGSIEITSGIDAGQEILTK